LQCFSWEEIPYIFVVNCFISLTEASDECVVWSITVSLHWCRRWLLQMWLIFFMWLSHWSLLIASCINIMLHWLTDFVFNFVFKFYTVVYKFIGNVFASVRGIPSLVQNLFKSVEIQYSFIIRVNNNCFTAL